MRAFIGRHPLATILAVAFLVRAAAGIGVQIALDRVLHRTFLIAGDANGYWELGRRIAQGDDFSLYDPPRFALRMPGFPALLAACRKGCSLFGVENMALPVTRVVLAAVATLGCWFVYLLGRTLLDERIGLWAAALLAVSPAAVGFSVLILSETLFAVCITGHLCVVAAWMRRLGPVECSALRTHAWAIAAGTTGAIACTVRPSWLLAAPMLAAAAVFLSRCRGRAVASGCVMLAGLFAALLPWGLRNQRVTGHFVLTTLWVGPSLYDGLNPKATGASDMRFFDRDDLMRSTTEYDVDRHYRRLAWEFVREHPGRAVQLALLKLARYASPWPNASEASSGWIRGPIAAFSLLAFAAALQGTWTHRANLAALALCAGPIVYFAAIHSVFVGSLRYRLPAEYPLYVLSAAGIVRWVYGLSKVPLPRSSAPT